MESFNIWDDNNALLKREFAKENYIINEYENDSNLVAIYFSSNGLYYPDTEEVFTQRIIEENRYEWQHYKISHVKKEMFFRDIYKSWYITGINEKINSVDKLVELIKLNLPENSVIVTVGSSAGGYMAALIGTIIGADWVLNFSGQNNLLLSDAQNPYVQRFLQDAERSKYFDLNRIWLEYGKPLIFYFWSADNGYDIEQFHAVKDLKSFYPFAFKTKKHEQTMYNFNLPIILNMQKEELLKLYVRYSASRKIGRFAFSVSVCGLLYTCKNILKKLTIKCIRTVWKGFMKKRKNEGKA